MSRELRGCRGRRALVAALVAAVLAPAHAWAHEDAPSGGSKDTASTAESTESTNAEGGTGDATIDKWVKRFKGSSLLLDQSLTPDTLSPAVQQSAVPSYQWWISLRPRYYITPKLSIRARVDLTVEWLNAADTTYTHELQWGDVWLDTVYTGIPRFGGIETAVGWRFLLPASKGSMMRGNILGTGPTVGLSRDFRTKIGEFGLSLGLSGSYTFTKGLQGTLANGLIYDCQSTEFSPVACNQNSPAMNPAFTFTAIASARYAPIPRLSLNVTYVLIDQWLYSVPPTTLTDITGGTTVVEPGTGDQRLRQSGWFLASADVEVQKWLSLSLGYYVFRPILDPNSTYGNPFWSPGGNTRIFFTVALGLDQVYAAIALRAKHGKATSAAATNDEALARF